jgi:hypothetical protein
MFAIRAGRRTQIPIFAIAFQAGRWSARRRWRRPAPEAVARFLHEIGSANFLCQGRLMHRTDVATKSRDAAHPIEPAEMTPELYEGLDLAPKTQESLVTWDVSAHARREQDRLSSASAYRTPKDVQGGY